MMIGDDKAKVHSMFIKGGLRFGGMRKQADSRFDQKGNIIAKKAKNHHISFLDEISKQEKPIADVIIVESYKEYNLEN